MSQCSSTPFWGYPAGLSSQSRRQTRQRQTGADERAGLAALAGCTGDDCALAWTRASTLGVARRKPPNDYEAHGRALGQHLGKQLSMHPRHSAERPLGLLLHDVDEREHELQRAALLVPCAVNSLAVLVRRVYLHAIAMQDGMARVQALLTRKRTLS